MTMSTCSSCRQQCPTSATFCTSCGSQLMPFMQPMSGRPVISMTQTTQSQPESSRQQPPVQSTIAIPTSPLSSPSNVSSPASTVGRAGPSTKVVALVVAVVVVLVAGVIIYSSSRESRPQQADSSSAQIAPRESDASGESTYDPSDNNYSYSSWDDYPSFFRTNYLDACNSSSGNYEECLCTLEKMEEVYTWDEAVELDAAASAGEDLEWLFQGLLELCL